MDAKFFRLSIAKTEGHFTDLQVPAKSTEVGFLETPQDLSQDQPIPAKGGWKKNPEAHPSTFPKAMELSNKCLLKGNSGDAVERKMRSHPWVKNNGASPEVGEGRKMKKKRKEWLPVKVPLDEDVMF
uniref:Uncharacterized protein n=1 Tax=Micrurus carvalhoi TaxID=3147026 RepID=A0A2H6N2U7_9SAUR